MRPMTSRLTVTPIALLATALLAGCTSGNARHTAASPATTGPSVNCDDPTLNRALYPQCPPLEGPASQAHRWPNGLTVQVVRLEKLDPKLASELKPSQTLVRLTLSFTNSGTDAVPLQKDRFLWHLLSSPNRFEDSDEEGWNTTADQLTSPVPEQVAAGQSVTMFDSWAVPDDQLGSLAVRVDLAGDVVPWVFTDAQALLKG
jgi:hypothetical protein